MTGIVVTHGTNTLEETAYFLDLTTTETKPVTSGPDSDGPRRGPRLLMQIGCVLADDLSP